MLVPSTGANISGNRVRMSIRSAMTGARGSITPTNVSTTTARQVHAAPTVNLRLLFRHHRRSLRLARLGEFQLLVLDTGLLEQRRYRFRRNRAHAKPIRATVQLGNELLASFLVSRVIETQFLDHAPITRAA